MTETRMTRPGRPQQRGSRGQWRSFRSIFSRPRKSSARRFKHNLSLKSRASKAQICSTDAPKCSKVPQSATKCHGQCRSFRAPQKARFGSPVPPLRQNLQMTPRWVARKNFLYQCLFYLKHVYNVSFIPFHGLVGNEKDVR